MLQCTHPGVHWQGSVKDPDWGLQVQPFNINITEHGWKTCNRGDEWGTYKDVVNCNTCRVPGLRITKESIWGFFETRTPEDREGLPLERAQKASPAGTCCCST